MTKEQRHNQLVRRCSIVAITALATAFFLGMKMSKPAIANDVAYEKIYTNYTVQRGDTMTAIVKKYAVSPEIKSIEYYTREIMFLNHISDDNDIKEGENIVIPAYIVIHAAE